MDTEKLNRLTHKLESLTMHELGAVAAIKIYMCDSGDVMIASMLRADMEPLKPFIDKLNEKIYELIQRESGDYMKLSMH